VPCAFAFEERGRALTVYSALDEKPKAVANPRDLARVRDIVERPRVALLVDRWSEDWTQLAWLRLEGMATLLEPTVSEHSHAVRLLRARYPQYATHNLEQRPVIRVGVERASGWHA
jgi:PPOX class probable F420-dependent enzyme